MTALAAVAYAGLRVTEAILAEEDFRLTQLLGTIEEVWWLFA